MRHLLSLDSLDPAYRLRANLQRKRKADLAENETQPQAKAMQLLLENIPEKVFMILAICVDDC